MSAAKPNGDRASTTHYRDPGFQHVTPFLAQGFVEGEIVLGEGGQQAVDPAFVEFGAYVQPHAAVAFAELAQPGGGQAVGDQDQVQDAVAQQPVEVVEEGGAGAAAPVAQHHVLGWQQADFRAGTKRRSLPERSKAVPDLAQDGCASRPVVMKHFEPILAAASLP
ncbi:hypothetical protein SB14R_18340 [Pseudomonas oryzihabitans]|nr:hypothetical protein SB14R_18340 [Pseudomonas psychrotolerans]